MAFTASPGILLIVIAAAIAFVAHRLFFAEKHKHPLPPGPKGLPILGNVRHLPKGDILECHHWLKFKDAYGPISSITVLGQTFVILNDSDITLELLRDRAVKHSGRPVMPFSGDMIGWKHSLVTLQQTNDFRLHRKNLAKVAGSSISLANLDRIQEEESAHFLLNVLNSPEDLFDHLRSEAGAVILKTTYGYTPEAHGKDPLVELATQTMTDFADVTTPGRYLVDVMPFLKFLPDWCPGTGFKAKARAMAKQLTRTLDQPYEFVKQEMRNQTHKPSYLSQAIETVGQDAHLDYIHKWSALSLYLGGADTSVAALMIFFLAMTLFPDVQRKAQEEIDRVIGPDRLPLSSDKPNLPYVEAVFKETHRWHNVGPMGVPHASAQEDTIRGYRIPKGALLLPNTWWFTHDPAVYPDPMAFRPDRFLTTPTHAAEPDPRNWTFGYGRRVCPGRHLADNAMLITIAQVLAVFTIAPPLENGVPVLPKPEFSPGLVSHPKPYRTSVRPRSDKHAALIRSLEQKWPWEKSDAEALATVKY